MSTQHVAFTDPDTEHSSPAIAAHCKVCRPPKVQPKPPTISEQVRLAEIIRASEKGRLAAQRAAQDVTGVYNSLLGQYAQSQVTIHQAPDGKRVRVEHIAPEYANAACDHCGKLLRGVHPVDAARFQAAHAAIHGMP